MWSVTNSMYSKRPLGCLLCGRSLWGFRRTWKNYRGQPNLDFRSYQNDSYCKLRVVAHCRVVTMRENARRKVTVAE